MPGSDIQFAALLWKYISVAMEKTRKPLQSCESIALLLSLYLRNYSNKLNIVLRKIYSFVDSNLMIDTNNSRVEPKFIQFAALVCKYISVAMEKNPKTAPTL